MPKDKGVNVDSNGNVAITGGLKITEINPTAEKGVIRWGPVSDKPEYYNGTAWVELGAAITEGLALLEDMIGVISEDANEEVNHISATPTSVGALYTPAAVSVAELHLEIGETI